MDSKDLNTHLEEYYRYLHIKKNRSKRTIYQYRNELSKFSNWLSDKHPEVTIENLNNNIVDAFQLYLDEKHITRGTQYQYLVAIRAFLLYLRVIGVKSLDPLSIEIKKEKTIKGQFLDENEIDHLFSVIDTSSIFGLRDRAFMELFYSSGLRLSELYSLNIDQVKDRKDIQIKGQGGKYRQFFISPSAKYWLDKYLEKRTDSEKALFISYTNRPVKDKRLSISSIDRMVKQYGKIAEFPFEITPRTLRHSFANKLLKGGASLLVVQKMLGHASLATTELYTSLNNKELSQTHKRLFKGDDDSNLNSKKSRYSQKRIIDQSIIDNITNKKLKKICVEINTTPDENVLSLANSIGEGLKWAVWLKAKQKNTKLKVNTGLEALLNDAIANNYFKWNASTRFLQEFRNNFMKQAFDMVRHDDHYIPDIKILNPQIDALESILKELVSLENDN